jgi:mRNA-degrading endonuclease toxin of MazEF toxin-antitoxin module
MKGADALFGALCLTGALTASVLLVHEATYDAPVHADVVRTARHGPATTAQVEVRNRTSTARCVQVRVVAEDRAGRELGAAPPQRVELDAKSSAHLEEGLTLTSRQYREQLVRVRAVVDSC